MSFSLMHNQQLVFSDSCPEPCLPHVLFVFVHKICFSLVYQFYTALSDIVHFDHSGQRRMGCKILNHSWRSNVDGTPGRRPIA
jgi:hypothetical protein